MSVRLTLRYLRRRLDRAVAAVVVVALLTSIIAGYIIAFEGVKAALLKSINLEVSGADLVIMSKRWTMNASEVREKLKGVRGVTRVAMELELYGELKGKPVEVVGVSGFVWLGVDVEGKRELSSNECAVSESLMEVLDLRTGEEIEIQVYYPNITLRAKIVGVAHWRKLWLYETPPKTVYVNISYLWEELSQRDLATAIYVDLSDEVSVSETAEEIRRVLGDTYIVLNVRAIFKWIEDMVASIEQGVLVNAVEIYVGAILILAVIFWFNFMERQRDVAILKSLGAKPGFLLRAILLETLLLSLIGWILGLALSLAVGSILARYTLDIAGLTIEPELRLPVRAITTTFIVGFVVPLVATIIPAVATVRVRPREVLRESPYARPEKLNKPLLAMGIFFLSLGIAATVFKPLEPAVWWARQTGLLVLLPIVVAAAFWRPLSWLVRRVVGVSAYVSLLLLRRKITRAVVIVAMIGLGMSWACLTAVSEHSWYGLAEDALAYSKWDIIVSFPCPLRYSTVSANLSNIDEVEDFLLISTYHASIGNTTVSLLLTNFTRLREFIEFDVAEGSLATFDPEHDVAVFNLTLQELKKTLNYLDTGARFNMSAISVVGIPCNITARLALVLKSKLWEYWIWAGASIGASFLGDFRLVKVRPIFVSAAIVRARPNVDVSELKAKIEEEFGGAMFASAYTKQEWEKRSAEITQRISAFFYAISYFFVVLSIVLILVIEMKFVRELRRELGILRAMGVRAKSLVVAFILYAIFCALIAMLAILMDLPLSAEVIVGFMKREVPFLPLVIPWMKCVAFMLAITNASVLGAIIPAWRVGRMKIAEAIAVE